MSFKEQLKEKIEQGILPEEMNKYADSIDEKYDEVVALTRRFMNDIDNIIPYDVYFQLCWYDRVRDKLEGYV